MTELQILIKDYLEVPKSRNQEILKKILDKYFDLIAFNLPIILKPLYDKLRTILIAKKINFTDYHNLVDKFFQLGMSLAGSSQGSNRAEMVFKSLLTLIRSTEWDRKIILGKGSPLHNIGVIKHLQGDTNLSITYVTLALIEDIISDLRSNTIQDIKNNYKSRPAYKFLNLYYQFPEGLDNKLIEIYEKLKENLSFVFPEDIYTAYLIDRKILKTRINPFEFDNFYTRYIFQRLNGVHKDKYSKGVSLELFVAYLFLSNVGFEVTHNIIEIDAQIDLLVRNHNINDPILNELGRYILVECKNWSKKINAATIKKFIADLRFAECKSGIIISSKGITGNRTKKSAYYTIRKEYHKDGIVIIAIDLNDIKLIIDRGIGLRSLLVNKYEEIRFDQ